MQNSSAFRRIAVVTASLGIAFTLAGCSAGQVSQTASHVAAVNGASGKAGQIDIQNVQLAFPERGSKYTAGSSAPLRASLVNAGNQSDRLVSVSTPFAQSVEINGEANLPAGSALHAKGKEGAPHAPTAGRSIEVTLTGLTQEVRSGQTIPMTFAFAKSGSATLQVPIAASTEPRPEPSGGGGH